jgi:hypothetical protein
VSNECQAKVAWQGPVASSPDHHPAHNKAAPVPVAYPEASSCRNMLQLVRQIFSSCLMCSCASCRAADPVAGPPHIPPGTHMAFAAHLKVWSDVPRSEQWSSREMHFPAASSTRECSAHSLISTVQYSTEYSTAPYPVEYLSMFYN